MSTINPAAIVEGYTQFFCLPSNDRPTAIMSVFAPDAYVADVLSESTGHAEILAMATGLQAGYPGYTLEVVSASDHHHQQIRFEWSMFDGAGALITHGAEVLIINTDGLITKAFGFLGHRPAAVA